MSEHTPEPWETYDSGDGLDCVAGKAGHVCRCELLEDARRIVACVNACAGIDTGMLEQAAANFDLIALHKAQARADEAEALLKRISDIIKLSGDSFELADAILCVEDDIRTFLATREDKG